MSDTAATGVAPRTASQAIATVVFVDDDRSVVDRMRDLTSEWHDVWDVHTAVGGQAALMLFERLPRVDVVVTDLDLAGIPAADVLLAIRTRSPHTARIVMSDRADRASVLNVIGGAHRYLSKPVDIELLVGVIEHVRGASHHELREPVSSLIGQVDRLPSPPALFQRLSEMMAANDWTIDGVAIELAQDVALTAEILKLVNSAFYGIYGEVTSVNRSIALIGIDMIRSVVLGNKVYQSDAALETWLDLTQLSYRSNAVAFGARALACRDGVPAESSAAAYLTGIVSEIGLLVLARVPDISPSIAQPLNQKPFVGAERAIFGGDRFEVGCELLTLWGFSTAVIDAMRQLSHPPGGRPEGLAWYLAAARRLVVDVGLDPHDLADPPGTNSAVDDALDCLERELAATAPSD